MRSEDFDTCVALDHVAIAVEDLERSIQWYTGQLGFTLLETRSTHGARTSMISAVLKSGSIVVVLLQSSSKGSQIEQFMRKFGAGVQHMAFSVRDLDLALDRAGGVERAADTAIIADTGIRQAFLKRGSGSGVRIELIERRGGTFSDRSVSMLFREFEDKGLF